MQHHMLVEGGELLPASGSPSQRSHTVPTLLVEDRITLPLNVELTWRQSGLMLLALSLAWPCWHALSWLGEDLVAIIARLALAGMPLLGAMLFGWLHPLGRPLEQWLFVLWRFWRQPRYVAWSTHPRWSRIAERLLERPDLPEQPAKEACRRWVG